MLADESAAYLTNELKKIEIWEEDQKSLWFWERLGRLPFKLIDRITPQFIHRKVGQALDELGNFVQTGGQYLVKQEKIESLFYKEFGKEMSLSEFPLQSMDAICDKLIDSRKKLAMTQGATTGIGGIFTLTIDIPLLLGISLKTLQEIAICYGYNPKEKNERIFVVKCLQFASSDIVGKQAILHELQNFTSRSPSDRQIISEMQGWREVMLTYRDNFGWKKLFQAVPIAGIIFGSYMNRSYVHDIGETGKMMYKKRRIIERLGML